MEKWPERSSLQKPLKAPHAIAQCELPCCLILSDYDGGLAWARRAIWRSGKVLSLTRQRFTGCFMSLPPPPPPSSHSDCVCFAQTPTLAAGSSTRKQYLEQVLETLLITRSGGDEEEVGGGRDRREEREEMMVVDEEVGKERVETK